MKYTLGKLKFEMDVKSIMDVAANVDATIEGSKEAAAGAMDQFIDYLGTVCDDYVPRNSGTLARSQYKKPARVTDRAVVGELGYGGPNDQKNPNGQYASTYMVYVHEDLTQHHPVGSAKFLEGPVLGSAAIFQETLRHGLTVHLSTKAKTGATK